MAENSKTMAQKAGTQERDPLELDVLARTQPWLDRERARRQRSVYEMSGNGIVQLSAPCLATVLSPKIEVITMASAKV